METVSCFCYFAILHMETVFARFCPVIAIPFISGFLFITTVAVHITEQLNSVSCLAFKSHWICEHNMFNWISYLGSDHNIFNWISIGFLILEVITICSIGFQLPAVYICTEQRNFFFFTSCFLPLNL